MYTSFHPKVILLIGASSGIGQELCQQMLASHKVIAISRNPWKGLTHEHLYFYQCDIAEPLALQHLLETIAKEHRVIDAVIYNSGVLVNKPMVEQTQEEMNWQMQVNFFGFVEMLKGLKLSTRLNEAIHIIYIGSLSGYQNSKRFPGLSIYGASKAAAHSLVQSLAAEFEGSGIRINAIALGAVDTEMLQKAHGNLSFAMQKQDVAQYIIGFMKEVYSTINGQIVIHSQGDL
ncbi:MAG: SDR family NAD(P)-dependent oxidoreductase [Flavobacteriales bacterium]